MSGDPSASTRRGLHNRLKREREGNKNSSLQKRTSMKDGSDRGNGEQSQKTRGRQTDCHPAGPARPYQSETVRTDSRNTLGVYAVCKTLALELGLLWSKACVPRKQ